MASPQKGAIGVDIILTVKEDDAAVDIGAATELKIILGKPDGTSAEKTAELVGDGADGKLKYTTAEATDLDQAGVWKAQPQFTLGAFNGRCSAATFEVKPNVGGA